jgi:TolB-like protein/DNA-binding winged helix-turn-helix (wHTH) protein/Tfp pilus assembly protein PilF
MIYEFADLQLDIGRHKLTRQGQEVPLPKLSFNVLVALVQAAPDMISHDDLIERVWGPNRVVTAENLAQRMMMLRNGIGDDSGHPRYIEGVRGEGYRLVPDVTKRESRSGVNAPRNPFVRYAVVAVLLFVAAMIVFSDRLVDTPSSESLLISQSGTAIAVLPFANFSPDPDNAYYAAGIHEEILNHLAKLKQLQVISRTSSFAYADSTQSIPEIANELSVDAIIEGSVRYANDRIRVTVQLVDGSTDEHLWSETYDRKFDDIFAIESDIAAKVADALRVTYTDDERALVESAPTSSAAAYADYLRGQDALARQYYASGVQYNRSSEVHESLPYAQQQYERAIAADPNFALAYAALSMVHIDHYWYGIDRTNERRQKALAAAQRARELQPDLPEARLAMGTYFYHGYHDYGAALQELDAVREQLPSNVDLHRVYSGIFRRTGRWEESLESAAKAIELDPMHVELMWNQSATLLAMRRFDEAREMIQRAISIAPDLPNLRALSAYIERFDRGNTEAGYLLSQAPPLAGNIRAEQFYWWHGLYTRDYDIGLEILDHDDHVGVHNSPFMYPRENMRALMYRLKGEQELARKHYEIAVQQLESLLNEEPVNRGTPNLRVVLGEALVGIGEIERGVAMAERGLADFSPEHDAYFARFLQYEALMRVFLVTDPYGRGLSLLDEYLSSNGGGVSIEGMLPDPRLDAIRDDSRFVELVEKYRRPE